MIGNSLNVRCGRMVLSDLDQIKKNERDRRRRLRIEQVRQQSKEISTRIVERANKIKRDTLSKLEKDGKSELRQMHDRKIMDIQNKYQEDLEDIGQAHASAALQADINVIIEEEGKKDRAMALKRGKEAMEWMKEAKQTDDAEAVHQERLRKVREIENVRAAMVSKIPKPLVSEESKKVSKKVLPKKSPEKVKKSDVKEPERTVSPKPGPSGLQKKATVQSHELSPRKKTDKQVADHNRCNIDDASDDQVPRKTVPIMSTMPTRVDKADTKKIYNPKDYTQNASSSVSNSSSSDSTSDDSSYFSDTIEQITIEKTPKTPCSTKYKLRSHCDCNIHRKHVCDRPLGIVQRIDIRNEPNAMEVARAMKRIENSEAPLLKTHKSNVERRGEDAMLREKVRRDYQALLKNLDLAKEECKLKASQICSKDEDPCIRLHQRIKSQEGRQKKMNRAVKRIFCTDSPSTRCAPVTKRVITLPARKRECVRDDVPDSTCQNAHLFEEQVDVCGTQRDKESEMSREEQILDMLKKIEKQKRLLLKDFGAILPDNIFNVSTKSLFEDKMPTKEHETNTAKPLSPEIKVINMSSSDECIKQDRKMKTPSKSPAKKIEIAVQTALEQTGPVENKGVQVELSQENMHIQHSKRDSIERPPHPIEAKVIIITPETGDSSNNSSNSETNGMIIEIDKEEVIVTPKKRKSSVRASKRLSPRIYQKIRSTSVGSKVVSPVKKFLRTQSSSRFTPQKKKECFVSSDTAGRVDVHMSESTQVDDDSDPSQETRVSIDASAESSQTYSGVNDQDQALDKPYRIQRRRKEWIRVRDTSDTSTSFASPPPIKSKSVFDALSNVTSILEMLEFSDPGLEKLRRLQEISPVSTPETPSPRTMMMPSNIPHRDKISRMLKFNNSYSEVNDSNMMSSTQKDQSTFTNQSDIYQKSEAGVSKRTATTSQQPSSESCTCRNPQCKLLHIKFNNIHDYALKNCPEILQKYEELQNLCSERIASLTHLIERVRNDQKDINLSLINDDTNLMQASTPARNDAQEIRKLIDSIEGFHAQLARTLLESQRIMRENETVSRNKTFHDAGIQAMTSTPRSKLVDSVKTHIQKSKLVEGKPKIISNEKVNVQLNQFKMQQIPQPTAATKASERSSSPPCILSLHEKDIIDKLSKEILEQSKNLDKARTAFAALKNDETHNVSFKELDLKRSTSLECEKDSSTTKELTSTSEKATERENYIPTLTGIPKILRNHGNVTLISARPKPKPPVTLLNGLYRPELESSGHELSTIVEFDTTDTVNKSNKSPTKSKPSVHVAPLPVQQDQNSAKKSVDLSPGMKNFEKLSFVQKSQEATTICNSPEKLKSNAGCITGTEVEAERDYMLEKCSTQLQGNTTTEEIVSQTKEKLDSSISTDFNNVHKESKRKTTSTSLYSFSGISGISEITSSPSSEMLKHNSSPEEMEIALKKLGLGWAVTTLKKTREASALSSSSNSDVTPINTARRMISPTKKQHDSNGFPDISDVSSISIKEASKSTEQAVLLKGRTSTPKFHNSNSNSERSTTNTSESVQERSDSLTVPNMSLTKTKSDNKQLQSP
ncbi:hypothetical protein PUN28_004976 [Cardiocondyla obscurior]